MDQGSNPSRQTIEAARDAMADMKASGNDTVGQAKQLFDINRQMQERPWTMLGASVAAGYVLGSLSSSEQPSYDAEPPTRSSAQRTNGGQHSQPGMLDDVIDQFRDEFDLLKGAAMTTLTSMLQDMLKKNVPQFADAFEHARNERDQQAGMNQSSEPL